MIKAYLQIALCVKNENAAAGTGVYAKYKESFLKTVAGAKSKELWRGRAGASRLWQRRVRKRVSKTELFEKDVV